MNHPYQKYKQTSITSASREQLLIMMYEGAIRYMKRAAKAIDEKDLSEKGMNIGYAYDVVTELTNTLDHEIGGEIALNLEQLYMFVCDQLTQANINNERKPIDDSISIFETLLDGWRQAIEKLKKEQTAS